MTKLSSHDKAILKIGSTPGLAGLMSPYEQARFNEYRKAAETGLVAEPTDDEDDE